ncbi:toll-like receptor 4 [Haliotis rubra]|uniref:toll-like receptor 4 n=1 Tax=Haliotis rubra TaxID=36100 RepID=UPI001EE50BDE|nr:toll-like receptor 4 [Haliotis rubra]
MLANSYGMVWKLFVLRMFGLPFDKPDRTHFQFDIFLYYASTEDQDLLSWIFTTFRQEMEDMRSLRMCIPDRNFDVGVSTADEIVTGINNSWKTVIFVTEKFLEDEWCFFTLSSALYSTTTLMPKRVLLLYTQDVLDKGTSLPPVLDQLLDQGTAMELDTDSDDDWWAELQEKVLAWM